MDILSNVADMSGDEIAVCRELLAAQSEGREISDACARTIGSWYHDGGTSDSASFMSTGAVLCEPDMLYRELFRYEKYETASEFTRLQMDMMGTYLMNAGERGPVDGWSSLWIRYAD